MLRLLSDENFNGDILRGVLLRRPSLDVIRVQDTRVAGADDPTVLDWAAKNDRILLTHDRATMPVHGLDRVNRAEKMPGILVVHDRFPVGDAIQEILLVDECSVPEDWRNRVVYLPL